MKTYRKAKIYFILFLICISASLVCSILIAAKILPPIYWFFSIFTISLALILYVNSNKTIAKYESDMRHKNHSTKK